MTALEWANRNGWDLPDTGWMRTAVALLSNIDTGPHNIHGGHVAPLRAVNHLSDDEVVRTLHGRRSIPIEGNANYASMRCANVVGPRFTRLLIDAVDRYDISQFEIRPAEVLAVADMDFVDTDEPVTRGLWDNIELVVFGDDRALARRVLTEVSIWPLAVKP